jgi:hypothetical protein
MVIRRQATEGTAKARDRRACSRFKLKGDAWFQWETADGRHGEGEGVTRNLARAGTFIETSSTPPVYSKLRVIVTLRGRVSENMTARLCGVGFVRHVRSSEQGVMVGFGAAVPFHTQTADQAV